MVLAFHGRAFLGNGDPRRLSAPVPRSPTGSWRDTAVGLQAGPLPSVGRWRSTAPTTFTTQSFWYTDGRPQIVFSFLCRHKGARKIKTGVISPCMRRGFGKPVCFTEQTPRKGRNGRGCIYQFVFVCLGTQSKGKHSIGQRESSHSTIDRTLTETTLFQPRTLFSFCIPDFEEMMNGARR